MPKVNVYNKDAKNAGEIELSDDVFAVEVKDSVIHQVYVALEANARQPWADTKDKSEVRGGGRKPWKQKGTGRARHGSNRSPIWSGGGVTFGPLSTRNYKQKINSKVNRKAVKMCLTSKLTEERFIVIENFEVSGKTKEMNTFRNALPGAGYSTLLLVDKADEKMGLATRNIEKMHMQRAQDVNVVDLMHHQYIITTKAAAEALEKRLA